MNPLPSIELIKAAAEKLGAFREEVVFVGGAVVGLLLTDPAAPAPRFTRDVDVVMNLMSRMDFYRAEDRLRALGFTGDPSGPVCRYLHESVVLDLLPSSPEVIGFASRWYPLTLQTAWKRTLDGNLEINVISAPCFLATKMEAFTDTSRDGHEDLFLSRDFEDLIRVLDGRPEVVNEVRESPDEVRHYLALWLSDLRRRRYLVEAIAAHVDPGREEFVMARLDALIK